MDTRRALWIPARVGLRELSHLRSSAVHPAHRQVHYRQGGELKRSVRWLPPATG